MAPKKTQGRKKIQMKMIEDENARMTTFSKRKGGIFKKALELATLCGIRIALIIFSIKGKAYSFGHPSVQSVVDEYVNENAGQDFSTNDVHNEEKVYALKKKCDEMQEQLDEKKKLRKALLEKQQNSPYHRFEEYISKLNLQELKGLKHKMEAIRQYLALQVNQQKPGTSTMHWNDMDIPGSSSRQWNETEQLGTSSQQWMDTEQQGTYSRPSDKIDMQSGTSPEVDLGNIDKIQDGGSPIPSDWLKL